MSDIAPRRRVLDRFRVDGRVALVTGASSGLGRVLARALAEAGADVVLAARRRDRLVAAAEEIHALDRQPVCVATDVTDPEQCRRLAETAVAELGRIDILVNCAGAGVAVPAVRESPEQFRRIVDVNLMGTYWMCQAVLPAMPRGASIVNIASVAGLVSSGLPQAGYVAGKAGVIGLTRELAMQWTSRKGVRVNALAPGLFDTEMTRDLEENVRSQMLAATPIGRPGDPDELAAALLFLASDAGSYVTGLTLPVAGGLVMS